MLFLRYSVPSMGTWLTFYLVERKWSTLVNSFLCVFMTERERFEVWKNNQSQALGVNDKAHTSTPPMYSMLRAQRAGLKHVECSEFQASRGRPRYFRCHISSSRPPRHTVPSLAHACNLLRSAVKSKSQVIAREFAGVPHHISLTARRPSSTLEIPS